MLSQCPPPTKVMLVTGAGRGIGAATARLAATRGYAVCVNYAGREDSARQVVDSIVQAGGKAFAFQADVSDPAAVKALFKACDDRLGTLDVLVNNAGIIMKKSRTEDISAERLARIFAVNVAGSFLCAGEAIRRMSTRHGGKGGSIINLGSIAAKLGAPGDGVDYAATKGAIHVMTYGLGKELAAEGIRVNAVAPALIETDIHGDTGVPDRLAILTPNIPMGRVGTADEVAEAILWLASDAASYSVSSIVEVSGGRC